MGLFGIIKKALFGGEEVRPVSEKESLMCKAMLGASFKPFLSPLVKNEDFSVERKEFTDKILNIGEEYIAYRVVDNKTKKSIAIAMITIAPGRKKGHIEGVNTEPKYQRRGMQNLLLDLIEQEAKQKGLKKLWMGSSEEGAKLYKSKGYKRKLFGKDYVFQKAYQKKSQKNPYYSRP